MELPFKYMVLCIIKKLNDRKMPLVINKISLLDYFSEFMEKSYFTIKEKKEIMENFGFDFELVDLCNKYYKYFEVDSENVIFDSDYASEIDSLIIDERNQYDDYFIHDIDFVIEEHVSFLDIIGVKIRKNLYNYLSDLEKDIESCYNEMCDLEIYVGLHGVNTNNLINKIKKLNITKTIMFLNTKNLLSKYEYYDLIRYASNVVNSENYTDDVTLLLEDEYFDMSDIVQDTFLRSIFIGNDSYTSNLRDKLVINMFEIDSDIRCSIIKFYLTFLDLLEKEIGTYNEVVDMEIIRIKYKIMNIMDSVYGTTLFIGNNRNILGENEFKERYNFIEDAALYFAKEILMYDDMQYRNDDYSVDNTLIYLDNIMKKVLITTYYKLTGDENIVDVIKGSLLYGVNTISSGFLKDIVDKSKNKVKEK